MGRSVVGGEQRRNGLVWICRLEDGVPFRLLFSIFHCFLPFSGGCGVSHLSCHYYSQKKVENVDLIVQNKLYISNECRKSFGGFHSSFTVSSVIYFFF